MQLIREWQRPFRIWQYSVSYSRLLLRSVNVDGTNTRVDVLFSNTEMMHLTPRMDHLSICEVSFTEAQSFIPSLKPPVRGRIYFLNSGDAYIYATHCEWHEDEGGPASTSHFGPLRGTN